MLQGVGMAEGKLPGRHSRRCKMHGDSGIFDPTCACSNTAPLGRRHRPEGKQQSAIRNTSQM